MLSNAIKYGTKSQKGFLHEKGVLDCFIFLLISIDKKTLIDALEGILDFLKGDFLDYNKDDNSFKKYFKSEDTINKINGLQANEDEEVSRMAEEIIKIL